MVPSAPRPRARTGGSADGPERQAAPTHRRPQGATADRSTLDRRHRTRPDGTCPQETKAWAVALSSPNPRAIRARSKLVGATRFERATSSTQIRSGAPTAANVVRKTAFGRNGEGQVAARFHRKTPGLLGCTPANSVITPARWSRGTPASRVRQARLSVGGSRVAVAAATVAAGGGGGCGGRPPRMRA